MDYNVHELDDIDVIVKDTNVQMELENKLVSDLMKSLEYEHQQEKDKKSSQDGKKEEKILPDYELKKANFCESSESHERDQVGIMEYRGIPLIVVETEDELNRQEYDEKRPGKHDKIASPGETTRKHDSKEEDLEFEINMEHFQKQLSDIVKDDMNTQARKKDIFSSILEELEPHIEKEAIVSCSEDKTDTNEGEFETILRARDGGQCCSTTSELEITCDAKQGYLRAVPSNTSDDVQTVGLDSKPVPAIMDYSVPDSPMLIESTKRSELVHDDEGQSQKSTPETFSDSEPRYLEHLTNSESVTPEDLFNYTTHLSNKLECFEETKNTVLDPQGQNDEILFISADTLELKNADDVMPCEPLEGGSRNELPHPPEHDIEKTNIPFQEDVMDNVDLSTGSLSGSLSRNDVDNELRTVDLRDGLCGGSLEERFKLPINICNGGVDRTRCDLVDEQKILAAAVDDDKSRKTMSRKGELYTDDDGNSTISTASEETTENEGVKNPKKNEIACDERMEIKQDYEVETECFKVEEKNLISFDDDDVLVNAQGLPLATVLIGTTVSEREESGQKLGHFDLLTEVNRVEDRHGADVKNKIDTNFISERNILSEAEEDTRGGELKGNEMKNKISQNEREIKRDLSVPVIGTLVEISPQCREDELSPETAGIPLGPFENTSVIINSCKDQILSETPACTDMYSNEQETTNIISKLEDVGDEKQTKDSLEKSMEGNDEEDRNDGVLSCEEVPENSCDYDGLNADSGNDSRAQSHEIQTMNKNNCYQKDEEVVGKKIEDIACGSTKRQRDQDAEIEVGLKKLKIYDTFDEEHSTNEQENVEDTREFRNSSLRYKNEEETQEKEDKKGGNNVHVMKKECYNNNEENNMTPETCITGNYLITSQELDSQDENEKRNVLLNLDENCELEYEDGTSRCASGIETSVVTVEPEIIPAVQDKSMELESLEEMSLNDDLMTCEIQTKENVERQHSVPCCYGDDTSAENKLNENENEEYDSGKLLDEEIEDGSSGKVEQEMVNFQEEIKQHESQPTEDCRVTGNVLWPSVEFLSQHLNELLIDEEEEQTDTEKTSGEEPLVQIPTDSSGHLGVTQDGVTRVTQCTGQEEQLPKCLVSGQEVEDVAVKVTQGAIQEEQIHSEGQTTEPEKGDVTQEVESVTKDFDKDVTQGIEKKEQTHPVNLETEKERYQKLEGTALGEERRVAPEVKDVDQEFGKETVQKVSRENKLNKYQNITQETEERVTQQDLKQSEQSVTQELTCETAAYEDVAQEIEKRIAAGGLTEEFKEVILVEKQDVSRDEKDIVVEQELAQKVKQEEIEKRKSESKENLIYEENGEVTLEEAEGQVTRGEEVTQKVAEEVTQGHKQVTQLEEKEKVTVEVQGVTVEVNAFKQQGREATQSEMEGVVTHEAEKNAKEEVDSVIKQLPIEKDRQQEEEKEEQNETSRENLEEKTMKVKRQEREREPLESKDEIVNQSSTDKQQEVQLKDLEKKAQDLGINSQENRISEGAEAKMKLMVKEEERHEVDGKSCETGRNYENTDENEVASLEELEKDEDKKNRIRSFEMLVHLETIIKGLEMYRSEQKKLRDSFRICMNEIMNNLSSMTKAVQLMETRLNQKIKDAHDELKKCCGNLEDNRATILSMDTLLRSYTATQNQFGDLRKRVKDLEIICTALNRTEMKDEISNQVSAEIDAMDRRVRFTENDVSDLKLRVTELEVECSSLRKLSPVEEQIEIQVGKRELKFGRGNMRQNSSEKTRENLNEELALERSSPVIGPGQRYYGLYSEEV